MGFRLARCTLILDDLELAYFKVIKIAHQIILLETQLMQYSGYNKMN